MHEMHPPVAVTNRYPFTETGLTDDPSPDIPPHGRGRADATAPASPRGRRSAFA